MIEVTAEFNVKNGKVVDSDYFRETQELVTHKYLITIRGITYEQSDFLASTCWLAGTSHSWLSDDEGNFGRHIMCISAGDFIAWGRRVFCPQEQEIADMISGIAQAVIELDPGIGPHLVSDCVYRNGICTRAEPCGRSVNVLKELVSVIPEKYYRDARNEKLLREIKGETIH